MHYKCKSCKKVIARSNPKAPPMSSQISLIQADPKKHGYYFEYPTGHCKYCKKPYNINPKTDLFEGKELDKQDKKELTKEAATVLKEKISQAKNK